MRGRSVVIWTIALLLAVGVARAQPPAPPALDDSSAQAPAVLLPESAERVVRPSSFYAACGILVAPPIIFDLTGGNNGFHTAVMAPIPSTWAAIGFRRPNDVSWQASFMLVPLSDPTGNAFQYPYALTTTGLDVDRISTNRSSQPDVDLRWQVGLRIVGIGVFGIPLPFALGPHAGLRYERPVAANFSMYAWGDVGVLPSLLYGIPLIDLRSELGLTWRPERRPGLSVSVGAFQETAGFVVLGYMTPGITTKIGWKY